MSFGFLFRGTDYKSAPSFVWKTHTSVNKDLFGEIIEFYNNDYQRSGTTINSSISAPNSKYDGLIYASRFKTRDIVNTDDTHSDYINLSQQIIFPTAYLNQELAFTYAYDEFNQLAYSQFATYNNSLNYYTGRTEYAENGGGLNNMAYDRNGNLTRLVRQAYSGQVLDDLTYANDPNSNKLTGILDAATTSFAGNFATPSQTSMSPFVYNSMGQMTQSSAENVSNIAYMPDGKIKKITFTNNDTTTYEYGADGSKIKSKYYQYSTTKTKYTWYSGPYIYELDEIAATPFRIADVNVSTGVIHVNGSTVGSGYLVYEATDHLGNVRATYKSNGTGNGITVLSANDYYTFGGQLPGRTWSNTGAAYRFGYQEQEKGGTAGNPWYQFELRMYNQDIGRWFAPDPYGQFTSPYIGMANNPVSSVDPDGGIANNQAGGVNSREYMKEHHLGAFDRDEQRKNYLQLYNDILNRFVNGDVLGHDKRDMDALYASILDLNNYYYGLTQFTGGIGIGLQTGYNVKTESEMFLSFDNGMTDGSNASSHAAGTHPGNYLEDNGNGLADFVTSKQTNLNSRAERSNWSAWIGSSGKAVSYQQDIIHGDGSETHVHYNLDGDVTAVIEKGANGSLAQTYNAATYENVAYVNPSNTGGSSGSVSYNEPTNNGSNAVGLNVGAGIGLFAQALEANGGVVIGKGGFGQLYFSIGNSVSKPIYLNAGVSIQGIYVHSQAKSIDLSGDGKSIGAGYGAAAASYGYSTNEKGERTDIYGAGIGAGIKVSGGFTNTKTWTLPVFLSPLFFGGLYSHGL